MDWCGFTGTPSKSGPRTRASLHFSGLGRQTSPDGGAECRSMPMCCGTPLPIHFSPSGIARIHPQLLTGSSHCPCCALVWQRDCCSFFKRPAPWTLVLPHRPAPQLVSNPSASCATTGSSGPIRCWISTRSISARKLLLPTYSEHHEPPNCCRFRPGTSGSLR